MSRQGNFAVRNSNIDFNSHAVAVRNSVRRRHVPLGTFSVLTRAFVYIFFWNQIFATTLSRISLRLSWWSSFVGCKKEVKLCPNVRYTFEKIFKVKFDRIGGRIRKYRLSYNPILFIYSRRPLHHYIQVSESFTAISNFYSR